MFSATTIKPTPLFNSNDLKSLFSLPFPLDQRWLLSNLETILYPGVTVTVEGEGEVVSIVTDDYPSTVPLFTHRRFLDFSGNTEPIKRDRPSTKKMIEALESTPFLPYIWGGNFPQGVPELFELFPPTRQLHAWEWHLFHLRGVDCSGLIYNVTHGTLPRNTGPMKNACEVISSPTKPLDLIFAPGHVLITLSQDRVIESRLYQGITVSSLSSRLKQLEREEKWISFARF